ncbi:PACE efflux transporter [Stappia indica]|uniref:PACE efflux transporter n=1 Tax=Stappia indica TaxID=538381 RepID=UPI001CD6C165|nr:PACE efflux transporter [Stappia indica]MCA1298762.1 PACE efflux transporter [Stappia indica]
MRTTGDRIRHALSFEIIGLLTIAPLGGWAFGVPLEAIGLVAIVAATIATLWNYIYNFLFDHAMLRIVGDVRKSLAVRVGHAVLFEAGLLALLMPFIAWYLDISLLAAFKMDLFFALFYLVYAFIFNWAYDLIFPIPDPRSAESPAT